MGYNYGDGSARPFDARSLIVPEKIAEIERALVNMLTSAPSIHAPATAQASNKSAAWERYLAKEHFIIAHAPPVANITPEPWTPLRHPDDD